MSQKAFIWSVSTCAFQIEGARNLGGRTDSIWDEFTKRNYHIPPINKPEREINSIAVAADFYHKYHTDIKIMEHININGFVYNMDWNRIFPKNSYEINYEGLKWHINLFETLLKHHIKPIPILFHWDTPLWAQIQGGWENRQCIYWFENYAKVVFQYLGKYSDLWFVTDENSSFTLGGLLDDYFPPARKDQTAFVKSLHHLNIAQALCKKAFLESKKENYIANDALIGIVHDWNPPIPYESNDLNDLKACSIYNEWFLKLFLDPNMKGKYPKVFLNWIKQNKIAFKITEYDMSLLQKYCLDCIGWNYYRPCYITTKNKNIDYKKTSKSNRNFWIWWFC